MADLPVDLVELYRNRKGCVYQSDSRSLLYVEFGGTMAALNIPCFICLKKAIDAIDLQSMALDMDSDIEIVTPCGCDRCYVLDLVDAYLFQELLSGAKVMLELNSILHQRVYRVSLVTS